MDLIIDSGNSRTKFCVAMGDSLSEISYVPNEDFLEHVRTSLELKKAKNILISATSSQEFAESIAEVFKANSQVFMLGINTKLPIQINYQTPHTLGQDRIANASYAATHFPKTTSLIIDAGTCITYDVLENGTSFLGGAIAPGLRMRFKAMNDYSARLPRLEKINQMNFPGTSTEQSLEAGVFYGILGEIHQFIEETKQSFGLINVLLTGGDTSYFEKAIKYPTFANPKITLLGLYEILQHSK